MANIGHAILPLFLGRGGSGNRGEADLPIFETSAHALTGEVAEVSSILPVFSAVGHGLTGEIASGAGELPVFYGRATTINRATAAASLPALTGKASTGPVARARAVLPCLLGAGTTSIRASGSASLPALSGKSTTAVVCSGSAQLPLLVSACRVGARATAVLPALLASAHAFCGEIASASADLPVFTGASTGLVSEMATAASMLPALSGYATARTSRTATAGSTLPMFTAHAHGLAGRVAAGAAVLPLIAGSATAHIVCVATVSSELPALRGAAWARQIPATLVYGGLAMNASNYAVTRYTGTGFNSLCSFNGKTLGANKEGIFVLEGKKDGTTDIDAEWRTPPMDLGSPVLSRLRHAWMTYRSDGELTLVLMLGEKDIWEEPFDILEEGDALDEGRVGIARGIRSRFVAFGVKNSKGADFEIDSLRIHGEPIPTRVR